MNNPLIIQAVGLIITALGTLSLIALTTLYGRPLSNEERLKMGKKNRDVFSVPINIETIFSAIVFLSGIGILTWSKFDLCVFVTYWLPNLPDLLMRTLQC